MRPALDTDELDLLQRACGLFLIGENLAQRILLLTGTAGGGKGTFVRVLRDIIGANNVGALRTQLLGERFELGRFLGKTLLYGPDVPDDFLNHRGASNLKALTGGDPVTLEFKNSNEAPGIVCKFNIVVTCNSRLTVHLEGDTGAWRRRLAIIEYRKPKPEKPIADLSEQIFCKEGPESPSAPTRSVASACSNVVANGSGAVNLTGLTKASTPFGGPSAIAADIGFILTGAPSGGISDGYFGYISNAVLSDSMTFNNATFASLGLTPGTYMWSWGTGLPNQNFTLIIGRVGVPDGGSTVSLLGCALLGLAAVRRRLRC
jgi:hypothetical protein